MIEMTASGSVSDVTTEQRNTIKTNMAQTAGVTTDRVDLQIVPASIKIFGIISVPSGTDVSTVQSALSATYGDATAASTATGLSVQSTSVTQTTASSASNTVVSAGGAAYVNQWIDAAKKAAGLAIGILVAIIVAPTVVVLCLLGLVIYCCCCKNKRKSKVVSTTA